MLPREWYEHLFRGFRDLIAVGSSKPDNLTGCRVVPVPDYLVLQDAKARLGQALSAAQHAERHLQVVGVGEWKPFGSRPAWNAEPRLAEEDS
jgi:hypothetical protein